MDSHSKIIGVIGAGSCDVQTYELAREVGRRIAEEGYPLICGGLGGVMEGACRGAHEAGGVTIGVLPGDEPETANAFVTLPIATGMGFARNAIIVKSATVLIAIQGGPGTLSEIAFALQQGVPVISLESFDVSPDIVQVATAEQAVEKAIKYMGP